MSEDTNSLKAEYFDVWFHCPVVPEPLPDAFGILTPCNPFGRKIGAGENASRLEALQRLLDERGILHFPVDGGTRDRSHLEPGFGVVGIDQDAVRALGVQFEQDAIFWVEGDRVTLLACNSSAARPAGKWSERCVDCVRRAPES